MAAKTGPLCHLYDSVIFIFNKKLRGVPYTKHATGKSANHQNWN